MARNDKAANRNISGASGTNPLLSHPAVTPMPVELMATVERRDSTPVSGARLAKSAQSGYVAPVTARLERTGKSGAVVARLKRLRQQVLNGDTLSDAIADGQLESWQAREPLGVACESRSVIEWDSRIGRTQADRVAVVDKALVLSGFVRRGGWRVSR